MVWFQVNIPLVVGCLLMGAMMDLRLFKLSLLVASILLMFLAVGGIVFGTTMGFIPSNAVTVLSVMVWLGCLVSGICRRLRSKRSYEALGRRADRTGTGWTALPGEAWILEPTAGRPSNQIASEFQFKKLILEPSGSTLYGVVLGEAGWDGSIQLVRLDEGSRYQTFADRISSDRPAAGQFTDLTTEYPSPRVPLVSNSDMP